MALSPVSGALYAWADCIAPVPLHWRRLSERGFNQSMLLAYHWHKAVLEQRLSTPHNGQGAQWMPNVLLRLRYTKMQMRLNARERFENVKGAFGVMPHKGRLGAAKTRQRIVRKCWLLIDDVSTTGMTGHACAKALMQAGAAEVRMLTLAWTPL